MDQVEYNKEYKAKLKIIDETLKTKALKNDITIIHKELLN